VLSQNGSILRVSDPFDRAATFDRGTLFGLETNGPVESIVVSLPPLVRWDHAITPAPGTREAERVSHLRPIDCLARSPN